MSIYYGNPVWQHTSERVIEMAVRLFKAYHARAVRVGVFFVTLILTLPAYTASSLDNVLHRLRGKRCQGALVPIAALNTFSWRHTSYLPPRT
jgi:hypothetical protein